MDCWGILGLDADADLRSIKRRYAQLLKTHRPDEDPEGFQRLREAYEHALQVCEGEGRERPFAPLKVETPLSPPIELPETPLPGPVVLPVESEPVLGSEPAFPDVLALSLDALEQALAEAESGGRRVLFEQALLTQCLRADVEARPVIEWALQHLEGFPTEQCSGLSPAPLQALANRLCTWGLEELEALLAGGQTQAFLERLDELLQEPWLQAVDRRAEFQRRLVPLLLEAPGGEVLFEPLCERLEWSPGSFPGDPDDWQTLVARAETAAFATRLNNWLREPSKKKKRRGPRKAKKKAAWLLLKPMTEGERLRFTRGFTEKDWAACGRLADTLRYRYPELLSRFGNPDLDAWQSLMPDATGWRYVSVALWLFILTGLLLQKAVGGSLVGESDLDTLGNMLGSVLMATLLTWCMSLLMLIWGWLMKGLEALDQRLSQLLLKGGAVGRRGPRLLRHLLGCGLLGGYFGYWSGLPGEVAWGAGLLAFLICAGYAWYAAWGVSPLARVFAWRKRLAAEEVTDP